MWVLGSVDFVLYILAIPCYSQKFFLGESCSKSVPIRAANYNNVVREISKRFGFKFESVQIFYGCSN